MNKQKMQEKLERLYNAQEIYFELLKEVETEIHQTSTSIILCGITGDLEYGYRMDSVEESMKYLENQMKNLGVEWEKEEEIQLSEEELWKKVQETVTKSLPEVERSFQNGKECLCGHNMFSKDDYFMVTPAKDGFSGDFRYHLPSQGTKVFTALYRCDSEFSELFETYKNAVKSFIKQEDDFDKTNKIEEIDYE